MAIEILSIILLKRILITFYNLEIMKIIIQILMLINVI